jgi:hypothetical protein
MKPSYLALPILLAGAIAGAHMIAPVPRVSASSPVAGEARKAQPIALASRVPEPVPNAQPAPTVKLPVPLRLSARPAITRPEGEMTTPQVPPSDVSAAGPQNESFAKAAIEQDGYRSVRGITKGPNGSWRAMALRGTTEVTLNVDANGNVSAQ